MQARLTIGEFSRMTHLSVKMLRRYHESGLLDPAEVDTWSGYRYYHPRQIATAQTIRRFRELDMPVREIRDLLSAPDDARRDDLIAGHLRRLEDRLEHTRDAVAALRRLLGSGDGIEVKRRVRAAEVVAAVRGTVELASVLGWYADAMSELDAALAQHGIVPTGPPGGLYDNELFTEETGELIVYIPVADPPTTGRVAPFTVPSAELAVVTHAGSHADIDVTYGELGRWVAEHGLGVGGRVRERYLVGPRDTTQSAEWRTEIGWPVRAA